MRLGCIVISDSLPPNHFYRGSPIIQLRNWADLRPVGQNQLTHPAEMLAVHFATNSWWIDICSESAVAREKDDVLAS